MVTKTHKPAALLSPLPHKVVKAWDEFVGRVKTVATPKRLLITGGASVVLLVGGLSASFFLPRSVNFSYAGQNCVTQPVLLPNLVSKKESSSYRAEPVASLSVAGYPLFARTTCIVPTDVPQEKQIENITFGTGFLQKKIHVAAGAFPTLASQEKLDDPVPTQEPLMLPLNTADNTFDYALHVGDASTDCDKHGHTLACNVTELNLTQSASYEFTLERQFAGEPAGMVFSKSMTTVESVFVANSSIAAGQKVQDKPNDLILTLNRPAVSMDGAKFYIVFGEEKKEVAAQATLKDNTVTVHFESPLARSASFLLEIANIKAEDGGYLSSPYALPFTTSGGPRVAGVSIGSYKVSTTNGIVITFDAAVSTAQALGNFIRLEVNGTPVAATFSLNGNKVTIKPASTLPRCTAITIRVLDGLENSYGIAGGSAWQYKSRTLCQTVFSIGSSVQGRSITAYSFGSGGSKIIFVGTTHGDEKSTTATLNSFVDYLESNAPSIPANRTVVVIPNLNPDGYAASRRTNAHNVDLNRNFPANDWKQGVTMPDGSYNANGGGNAPLSEPESKALANYVLAQSPRLVLTYHGAAGVVIPNDSGDSVDLAHVYDQKSNLYFAANSQTGTIFDYDTTGSFETWLHDSPGIATLLLELWTKSSNEFGKNQNAMWHMANLP
jgi:hypothetical protein